MPNHRTRPAAFACASAIALAAGLAGLGSARASVVTPDPILPPETGAYVGTNGGAGCFRSADVCA